MSNLNQQFQQTLREFPQITQSTMLLGVSGGVDSIVLLHLLHSNNCKIIIAHCNFGLRGDESDGDEQFVKDVSEKLKLKYVSEKFDTTEFAKQQGISIQMAARKLRQQWMEKMSVKMETPYICLAHHLDDNIETFFLNLTRGTGLKGVKCMTVLLANVFRPLLFATREQILEYARQHLLQYREDSSNSKDDYLRNRIRHHVIPKMTYQFPQFRETMYENFQRFGSGVALFDEMVEKIETQSVNEKNGVVSIDLEKLMQFREREILLAEIINSYGFTHIQARNMIGSAAKTETSEFKSPTHEAFVKNQKVEIKNIYFQTEKEFILNSVSDFSKSELPLAFEVDFLKKWQVEELKKDLNHAFLDASKIKFPLFIRKWKNGDAFVPFGMKGRKLLSDFFAGLKMTAMEKENVWLLCNKESIIWVIGYRTDNKYRVTNATREVIHLKVIKRK